MHIDKQLRPKETGTPKDGEGGILRVTSGRWRLLVMYICFGALVLGGGPATAQISPEATTAEGATDDILNDQSKDGSLVSDREKVELVEDSNVSEAVSRRPDLNFKNVTIDGERASVSLEDIQAHHVKAAEVSKAATPDLDADTRGSGLNLRSRATYEFEKRVINGSIETTFNPIIDKFESKASLTYGRSMGRWGLIFTGTTNQGRHASESYGQDWDRVEGAAGDRYVIREQVVSHDQGEVVEYKANGTIDFRIGENIRLYLKGDATVNEYEGYHPRLVQRYWSGGYALTDSAVTEVKGARIERNLTGWESESNNYTLSSGGYLDFDRLQMDYVLSYNERHYLEPDWFVINFTSDGIDLLVNASDAEFPSFTPADDAGFDLNDPQAFRFDRVSSQRWGNDDRKVLGTLNGKIPFVFDLARGYVMMGLKYRGFKRKQYSYTDVYRSYQGEFPLAAVVSDYHNPGTIDGRYDHGPMPDLQASRAFLINNIDQFVYSLTESRLDSDPGTWTAEEDISAAYGLIYLSRGDLRVVVGIRFEQTDLTYEAGEVLLDENGEFVGANRLNDSNTYQNFFPGIHFRYDRGPFSYTGSWSNTIWRPYYGMVVPYRYVSLRDEQVQQGNPDLHPSLLENYNAAVDYRVSDNTTLSLEFFYSDVVDMVYHQVTRVVEGPFAGYKLGTDRNGPTAQFQGVRVIWNQALGDIFPLLQAVSFNVNYAYNRTETVYPGRPGVTLPVPAYPEHGFQFNLRYSSDRIFAQLTSAYRGEQLGGIDDETWRDRYDYEQVWVSLAGSYSVTKSIRAFVNVHNLFDVPGLRSYLGDPSRPTGYGHDTRRFNVGLRFEL